MIKIKRKAITFTALLAFMYLTAPFAPAICHAFTHAVGSEGATTVHEHVDGSHHHEHDAEHHAIPLGEEILAIVGYANKVLLQHAIDHEVLEVDLFYDGVLSLNKGKDYPIDLEPPIFQIEELILYGHPANAPPV